MDRNGNEGCEDETIEKKQELRVLSHPEDKKIPGVHKGNGKGEDYKRPEDENIDFKKDPVLQTIF